MNRPADPRRKERQKGRARKSSSRYIWSKMLTVVNISLAGLDVSEGAVLLCSPPASTCTYSWKVKKVLGLFHNSQNIRECSHSFHSNSKTQPGYWELKTNFFPGKGMGCSVCYHVILIINPKQTVLATKKKILTTMKNINLIPAIPAQIQLTLNLIVKAKYNSFV